ncbi:MAG: hypothetical protein V1720_06560 [bacterium]
MKNNYLVLIAILLIAGFLFFGCDVNREKKVTDAMENVEQANKDLQSAQDEYEKEWQQFKSEAELKIDANEKSISELKVEIKTASGKFKAKYEREVADLELKNIELKKNISEYKYEGKDKWAEFKQKVQNDMDVVEKALKDIFASKKLVGN